MKYLDEVIRRGFDEPGSLTKEEVAIFMVSCEAAMTRVRKRAVVLLGDFLDAEKSGSLDPSELADLVAKIQARRNGS